MKTVTRKERLVLALVCVNVALVVLMMIAVAVAVGCLLGVAAGWVAAAVELMTLCLMCTAALRWAINLGGQSGDMPT